MQDHYKILELEDNATNEDIKRSYRKLALKYHPDKNNGEDIKFKEINEAYEILSDPVKKRDYDNNRKFGTKFKTQFKEHPDFQYVNEIFKDNMNSTASPEDLFRDLSDIMNIPTDVPGFTNYVFQNVRTRQLKTNDINIKMTVTLEEIYTNTIKKVSVKRKIYTNETEYFIENLTLDVNVGNSKMIYHKKANEKPGHITGNINVIVNSLPHELYKRNGNNLYIYQKIKLEEFIEGKEFIFKKLDGKNLKLKYPPQRTIKKENLQLVLPGGGLNKNGNLIIDVEIII